MAMTIEELNEKYGDKERDRRYYEYEAVLGSEADRKRAWDENGEFHCINWFNCLYCPAFNIEHCT